MIEISAPRIEVIFNVGKETYYTFFRAYWFGFCKGRGIENWNSSENGDYTCVALTTDLDTACVICDMLAELYRAGTDIDFVDVRRLWHECKKWVA